MIRRRVAPFAQTLENWWLVENIDQIRRAGGEVWEEAGDGKVSLMEGKMLPHGRLCGRREQWGSLKASTIRWQ